MDRGQRARAHRGRARPTPDEAPPRRDASGGRLVVPQEVGADDPATPAPRRDGGAYTVWRVRWYDAGDASAARRSTAPTTPGRSRPRSALHEARRARSPSSTPARRRSPSSSQEWWELYAAPNLERRRSRSTRACGTATRCRASAHSGCASSPRRSIARFRADLEARRRRTSRRSARRWRCSRACSSARSSGSASPRNPVKAVRKPPSRTPARGPAHRPRADRAAPRAHCSRTDRLARRDAGLRPRLRRSAAPGGARARVAPRPRAHAAHRAGGRRRRAQGPEDRHAAAHRRPARAAQAATSPNWRLRAGPAARRRRRLPGRRRRALARPRLENWRRRDFSPRRAGRGIEHAALRPAPLLRLAAHPRGPPVGRRDRRSSSATTRPCASHTYAHVIAELRDAPTTRAADQIRAAREPLTTRRSGRYVDPQMYGPEAAQDDRRRSAGTPDFPAEREALCRTRTDDPFLTMEVLYQLS